MATGWIGGHPLQRLITINHRLKFRPGDPDVSQIVAGREPVSPKYGSEERTGRYAFGRLEFRTHVRRRPLYWRLIEP